MITKRTFNSWLLQSSELLDVLDDAEVAASSGRILSRPATSSTFWTLPEPGISSFPSLEDAFLERSVLLLPLLLW